MTLAQANQVNEYYKSKENKVRSLKDSLQFQYNLRQLEQSYAEYIQKELIRNGAAGNQDQEAYYRRREEMWENRLYRQKKTNLYIFIGMGILFLFKH